MTLLHNKTILIISPEPWGQNFVSKHHYAVMLAKHKNIVYFLNPPSAYYKLHPTQYHNLYVVDYPPFLKGLRYLPEALQRKTIRQKYKKIQQLAQCTFDVVWSFDNSVFYDFSALPESVLKISHIMDVNQDFQTATAARTADICIGVTNVIRERLRQYNENSFKIQHGYTPQFITPYLFPDVKESIKAVYVGNLSIPFIDWEVISLTVSRNPQIAFFFVGPDGNSNLSEKSYHSAEKEAVKALGNTYFVGSVPHYQIPSLLQQADVLLLCYQEKHFIQAANSHKLLEYLASGKVVVATYTDEYIKQRELLAMSERNDDYPALFAEVINNLDKYDVQENQENRKQFALNNTYEKQLQRIESHIQYVISAKKIPEKSVH